MVYEIIPTQLGIVFHPQHIQYPKRPGSLFSSLKTIFNQISQEVYMVTFKNRGQLGFWYIHEPAVKSSGTFTSDSIIPYIARWPSKPQGTVRPAVSACDTVACRALRVFERQQCLNARNTSIHVFKNARV